MKKVALVTGGTSGLGAAISARLTSDGYQVVANYLPALEDQALEWQQASEQDGLPCAVAAADVSDATSCQLMIDMLLEEFKRVDIVVNNAGITRDATLKKMDLEQWQAVINTNLSSLYNVCKPVLENMQNNRFGRIVNISSVNAQRGQFGQTNYSAAKAGVHGFTKALAQEMARHGVTVNTISPGFINTAMVDAIPEAMRTEIIDSIPVGRVGQPEDIARAVRFLVDDNAGYITGSEISVNGGLFMH